MTLALLRDPPSADPAALRLFREYASARHLDLAQVLDHDLASAIEHGNRDDRVPATLVVDVLQQAALRSGRHDLGLDFARWAVMRTFGPLTSAPRRFATLAQAIELGARYLHLENGGLGMSLDAEGREVAIRFALSLTPRYGMSQFMESVMFHALGSMRKVRGPAWAPLRIELAHPRPAGRCEPRALFGASVDHDADRYAIVIAASDLHRKAASRADGLDTVKSHLEALSQQAPPDFASRVEQRIVLDLPGGGASLESIATALAMTPRTLQRRLKPLGLTFGDIISRARHRMTCEYIRTRPDPSLLDLTHRLGFSDPSVTSRYLAGTFHMGLRQLTRRSDVGSNQTFTMSPQTKGA